MSCSPSLPQPHRIIESFILEKTPKIFLDPFPSPTFSLFSYLQSIATYSNLPPPDHPTLFPAQWSHLHTITLGSCRQCWLSPPSALVPWFPMPGRSCQPASSSHVVRASAELCLPFPHWGHCPDVLCSLALAFHRMCENLMLPHPTCSQLWLKMPMRAKIVCEERQARRRTQASCFLDKSS